MADLVDIISDYSPPDGAEGVSARDAIVVEFSEVMDEGSVSAALFVEGPDADTVFGPNSVANIWPSARGRSLGQEADFLQSPGYRGIVQGAFSFVHVVSGTTVTFTPSQVMAPTTEYTAHLTNCYGRSVQDAEAGVSNTGNGELEFGGTWTSAADTIHIRITAAGVAGEAKFVWWRGSDPIGIKGPVLSTRRDSIPLKDGLHVDFGDGQFEVDDEFEAALETATLYEGHITFGFTTGTGEILPLPTDGSTSVLAALSQGSATGGPLTILSTSPGDGDAQVSQNTKEIVVTFSEDLDSTSITSELIEIVTEIASGHPSLASVAQGTLAKQWQVSGSKLTIKI